MMQATPVAEQQDVEQSWSAIEHVTHSMREAANSANWSEVVELAANRHHSLLRHFALFPVGPGNASFYQRRLNDMLAGERDLQALVLNARRQVMRDSVQANHNRKAMGAYLAN